MTRLKLTQPELSFEASAPKPHQIVTQSGDEFLELCERADRGELVIESVSVGRTPAEWVATVRYPEAEAATGYLGAMVARLGDVDVKRGRGVLEGNDRCLWTTDGCRITISLASDGGLCVGCNKDTDPEAPKP